MSNIAHSIQDYCKKINSRLTFIDIASLFTVLFGLLVLYGFLYAEAGKRRIPIVYTESEENVSRTIKNPSKPFGSRSGVTYTFSWCPGSTRIQEKNKVFFENEQDAKNSGRTLSKLCSK